MATTAKTTPTADLLQLAADAARRYVNRASAQRVTPSEESLRALQRFHEPFPDGPCDPREIVQLLDEIGSPATVVNTGGRFFGFVNGGALPAAIGSHWLADAWDQNANY